MSESQLDGRKRRMQKHRIAQLEADWQALMATPWGRRLCYFLVYELGALHSPSYTDDVGRIKDGIHAAMRMSRLEGRRGMAMQILAKVDRLAPSNKIRMMAEHIERATVDLGVATPSTGEENERSTGLDATG